MQGVNERCFVMNNEATAVRLASVLRLESISTGPDIYSGRARGRSRVVRRSQAEHRHDFRDRGTSTRFESRRCWGSVRDEGGGK